MTKSHFESGGFPVLDVAEAEEQSQSGLYVVRGLFAALRPQMVTKSHEPAIKRWTPRDAMERFVSVEAIEEREIDTKYYPLVDGGDSGGAELAGLIWMSPRQKHGLNYTFAVRLYQGYAGRRLGRPYVNTAVADFAEQHPDEEAIWLETDIDNTDALHLYAKTGWDSIIRGDTRETMVRQLHAEDL